MSVFVLSSVVFAETDPAAAVVAESTSPSAKTTDTTGIVNRVDQALASHWQEKNVLPASTCDDATFLRRIMLDLAGRIPRPDETREFLANESPDKRNVLIRSLLDGDEFPLHFSHVLDELIQERYAGNNDFVAYLTQSLREQKSWDGMFRDLMLGPWDTDENKHSNRFLDKRARDIDAMAADTARIFFGVDISCARCHDHPLVLDWSQEHYYGMAAFFARTTGGKGKVGEKKEGEVKFTPRGSDEQVAAMRFLSGEPFSDPDPKQNPEGKPTPISRRAELVRVAIEDKRFFSRALVNRLWDYFFGRGLVHPVDQMHSGNPAAIPEVLDLLANDFAEQGYDLKRLVRVLISIRLYGLDSRYNASATLPAAEDFAVMSLRPLQPRQLAFSLLLATSPIENKQAPNESFSELQTQRKAWEDQASPWMSALDARTGMFHSSTGESLMMSNHPAIHALVAPQEGRLSEKLSKLESLDEIIETAFLTVLSRFPEKTERDELQTWLEHQNQDHAARCSELVWALMTSAEFRFNH